MTKQNCTSLNQTNQAKKVHGVGYNSKGIYKSQTIEYDVWCGMLSRCYNPKSQMKRPTYIGCSVTDEWHDYQVFAEWYVKHPYYGMGYHLDKDLLVKGNKIYAPDLCCMVPSRVNSLLVDCGATKGLHPTGVDFHRGKFRAQIRKDGKKKGLGYFKTASEAHQAYVLEKEAYVKEVANEYRCDICDRTYQSLMSWNY